MSRLINLAVRRRRFLVLSQFPDILVVAERFEVRYKDGKNVERVMGWCGTREGVKLFTDAIDQHPTWHSPRVIDRKAGGAKA